MGVTHITLAPQHTRLTQLVSGGLAIVAVSAGITAATPGPAASTTSTAAIRLLDTVIGVGPSFDGFGATLPLLFYGTAVPPGETYYTVPYPAMINLGYPILSGLPILSDLPYWPETLKQSERVGAGYLEQAIGKEPAGEKLTILGYSQGTQVGEIARADMAKNADYVAHAQDYSFTFVGDPYQPNGGILSRFTAFAHVPLLGDLFPLGRPGPSDSPFKTTYYQNQYDGFADFPEYFNPLSIANALLGIVFEHVLPGYVFESSDGPNTVSTTVGNTTYVSIPQYLPLLTPLRLVANLFGAQRFVNALDPILRVFVEMGYNRTADPSQVAEFKWLTPLQKIQQGLHQLPAAIAEGLRILSGAPYHPTMPTPVVSSTEPTTPVTSHPAQPVDNSPLAQAVRAAVVNISAAITKLTAPLAKLLRIIGGKTTPAPAATPATAARQSSPSATVQATAIKAVATPSLATPDVAGINRKSAESVSATVTSGPRRPRVTGQKHTDADISVASDASTRPVGAGKAHATAQTDSEAVPRVHRTVPRHHDTTGHAPNRGSDRGESGHGSAHPASRGHRAPAR
jgi:hypothetical protein